MLQKYFNREEVYVRDIQIEDTQYGRPHSKALSPPGMIFSERHNNE